MCVKMSEILANRTNDSATNASSLELHLCLGNFMFLWTLTYYVLIGCGVFLNLLVIYVMLRSRKIRTSISSFLIFHLSLTHVLYHVVVPLLRISGLEDSPESSCKAVVFIELSCAAAIFSSLAAIAWDRHRNILQPFKSLAPQYLKTYLLLIASVWLYAFVTAMPFIFSVESNSQEICWKENDAATEKCSKYTSCTWSSTLKTQLSKTLFFITAFLIPFTYMLVAYTKSAVSLWKRSKTGEIHGAIAKCKVRTIRLMVMALLVFAVCWGLNFVVELLRVYDVVENNLMLQLLCFIAQASSSCLNPTVYAFLSPEFRKSCFKYCCCCLPRCSFIRGRYHYHRNRVQSVL